MDGGVDCATAVLAPDLGDLVLRNGAKVSEYGPLPSGILSVAELNYVLYGVGRDRSLHVLGRLPQLDAGVGVASVVTASDSDSGVFLGGALVASGTKLLAGYTKSGSGFPGSVVVFDTVDGGVRYVNAPGNYTAAALDGGFVVNGGGLESLTGNGLYVLDEQGAFQLASFDPAWMASSGYTAMTSTGVLLGGYFNGGDFQNYVRALAPSTYAAALAGRTSLQLGSVPVFASGGDLMGLSVLGADVVVVRGGYDATYAPFTLSVERVPVSTTGSSVDAGQPMVMLAATQRCTRVLFVSGTSSQVLVGVSDRQGRRVLRLEP